MAFIGCIIVTFLSAGVAWIAEQGRPEPWILKPDIELISIACSVSFTGTHKAKDHF